MNKITIGKATMMHLDCMEYMATLPDKYFELAIVDPPYGIGGDSLHTNRLTKGVGKLKNRALTTGSTKWDVAPTPEYFAELFRVSKHQIVWGGNYFGLPRNRGFIVWDKVQPWPTFSAAEYAWQSHDVPSKIFKFDNRTGSKIHPTQKPIKLYEWLLANYAKTGDKILDTHGGSFSSAIACNNLGFEFHGCELDADYFNEAVLRVTKAYCQAPLFEPAPVAKPKQEALL